MKIVRWFRRAGRFQHRVVALGLALGLTAGGLGAALTALPAAALAPVTFTGASQAASVTTSWTIGFTTGPAGALASPNQIIVTFDGAFSVPSVPTVVLGSGFSHCTATGPSTGNVVTLTLHTSGGSCTLPNNTAATLAILGITNPGTGSYPAANFSVSTTHEGVAVSPASPVVIGGTAPSPVTFAGTSQAAGVTTSWTIGFTTSATGALVAGDQVLVTFDPSFAIPGTPTVLLGSGFSHCTATASTTSNLVTITLVNNGGSCSLPNSTAATLAILGILNPGTGSYPAANFSVSTTHDPVAVSPTSPVVIGGSAVSGVSFVGSSQAANGTGTTWTVSFTTSASGALVAGSTISVSFAPGFAIPATPTVVLGSGFSHCSASGATASNVVTVTLANSGGTCTLPVNTAASLSILGITNPGAGSYPASSFTVQTSSDLVSVSPPTPVAIGVAPNGSGTIVVSPTAVGVASTGNTLVFTYTAATGGVASGSLTVTVPSGWSVPSTSGLAPGYTTSTCGTVSVVGSTIQVTGVSLASGGVCTITYGSTAAGGPGATAPTSSQISTFGAAQASVPSAVPVSLASSPQVSVGSATPLPIQIFGVDPIGTSIAISQAEFPTNRSATAVVLARDDFFSDALAGGPLAAAVNGPLLVTDGASTSSSLSPRVLAEIQRVIPVGGTVYILGGYLALSFNIDSTLQGLGYNVVRVAGADEFSTAYQIAIQLGSPSTIFEATGLNFFDALSAVPAAIQQHAAILLTNGNQQSFVTGVYIIAHPGITRYAIGGPLAAYGADPGALPVYGQNLFGTSAAVASTFFPGATIFGAATSASFTDALGGGVYMATGGRSGPLLLVNPTTPLPPQIMAYLATLAVGTQGYVFGGPLAVGPSVLTALQLAVG